MRVFPKPVVVTSKCLGLAACRYNGERIHAPFISLLQSHVDSRPVCPELEIGLGTPRDPIRLVVTSGGTRMIQPSSDRDLTAEMHQFSRHFLDGLPDVDGFILKSRSPSCGIKETKTYTEDGQRQGRSAGLFARAVLDRFPLSAIEDEGRLTNARRRHHFLVKIFARAAFRRGRHRGTMAALVDFHSRHKLQLLANNREALRAAGRIVANTAALQLPAVIDAYEKELARALARPARDRSNVKVLQHAVGYFSPDLTAPEERLFLEALDDYRTGRVALTVPLTLIQFWIARFEQPYLVTQTFFQPYPNALMHPRDSGLA